MSPDVEVSGRRQTAKPAVECPLDRTARRHFGAAGTSPYLAMTDANATLSGGPPAFATAADISEVLGSNVRRQDDQGWQAKLAGGRPLVEGLGVTHATAGSCSNSPEMPVSWRPR